jgi:predicted nucleic acid-binding protein
MSTISLGEISYIVERRRGAVACQEALKRLEVFPIQLQEATLERVMVAARLKARYTISYADAFAVGLAQELGAPVVTGDPEFEQVKSLIDVLWL